MNDCTLEIKVIKKKQAERAMDISQYDSNSKLDQRHWAT